MNVVEKTLAAAAEPRLKCGSATDPGLTPAEKLHNTYIRSAGAVRREAPRIAAYLVERAFELAAEGEVDRVEMTLNIMSPTVAEVMRLLEADGFNVRWTWEGDRLQLLFKMDAE